MTPPSFASAAAGSNANSARTDSTTEWARRNGGATQTFRRTSHATPANPNASASRETGAAQLATNPGVYVPPHAQPNRNGPTAGTRYSRDQLLDIYRNRHDNRSSEDDLGALSLGNWQQTLTNGAAVGGWSRREEQERQSQHSADVCWEREGRLEPASLHELSQDEQEIFSTSVNSPLKPPTQNSTKEASVKEGLTLRKTSISHQGLNSPGGYGLASPTGARTGTRRRETSDSYPFPMASPNVSRYPDVPANLIRRKTDFKDQEERDKDKAAPENPFGTLKRMTTAPLSAGGNTPTSPWSAQPSQPQGIGFEGGVFGNFALGSNAPTSSTIEKRPGFNTMKSESRFKGLMGKDSSEDMARSLHGKASRGALGKVTEQNNIEDTFSEDDLPSGSAALGGQDASPPRQAGMGLGTPHKTDTRNQSGFGAFGMTADNAISRDSYHGREQIQQQTPFGRGSGNAFEPMSPTNTNPYQSPENDKRDSEDIDTDGSDIQNAHIPGLGGFPSQQAGQNLNAFGTLQGLGRVPAGYEPSASDRSQTSSAGPQRNFPGLGSLGSLGGIPGLGPSNNLWGNAAGPIGTPARDKPAFGVFGGDIHGSIGDIQSPSLAGLGPGGPFGSSTGTIGRNSKLGSLFPASMQEQMRNEAQNRQSDDGSHDGGERGQGVPGAFGRNQFVGHGPGPIGAQRETESPFKPNFDERTFESEATVRPRDHRFSDISNPSFGALSAQSSATNLNQGAIGQQRGAGNQAPVAQPPGSSGSNQIPTAQQRQMVMPDRMRWIYRDPQGHVQGPWSGLEMHDWYKAGFFSPELLVKKQEDPDYEPLAQLIRRIGNSREPFLVPQIGIPHGAPSNTPSSWTPGNAGSAGGAQPPFASSFPSFGTTLTAEQQNALERRKQEEQWLMARQKEHLAQRQSQSLGHPMHQSLHHHSSAHSLHSQPSIGSITSPSGGYQPSPTQGPMFGGQPGPSFHDNSFIRQPAQMAPGGPIGGLDFSGNAREEQLPGMMGGLNLRGNHPPYGGAPLPLGHEQQHESNEHRQQVADMLNDRTQLQREQADYDAQYGHDEQVSQFTSDRLQQFHDLRAQSEAEQPDMIHAVPEGVIGKPRSSVREQEYYQQEEQDDDSVESSEVSQEQGRETPPEPLSLTEQVQKAASAKQTPVQQSPWGKIDPTLPQPFPPPQSQSPLPAPAARRNQNLADTLAAESRSRPETPSAETPSASVAPWAKEPADAPRGPSLKEIQEAEAKKAAHREEQAAAARRAAAEREHLAQQHVPVPAPGLPSSSTWASGGSPLTPVSASAAAAVWSKPPTGKPVSQTSAATKKTLSQIQKEEEARKLRAAAAANASSVPSVASTIQGKRYAELASKQAPIRASVGGEAWTTVGASGKVKTPGLTATPVPALGSRSSSASVLPASATKSKPTAILSRTSTATGQISTANATEELKKWAISELRGDIDKHINVDDFVTNLLALGTERELITEAVHSVSRTLDSRHFAEQFLRRRKLADKGIIDTATSASPAQEAKNAGGSGGWSEVAKKGGAATAVKDEPTPNYKVVAAKKKGSKK